MEVTRTDSTRNWIAMSLPLAPIALRTPTSRIRSWNEASMMFMITIPPTSSETMPVTRKSDVEHLALLLGLGQASRCG